MDPQNGPVTWWISISHIGSPVAARPCGGLGQARPLPQNTGSRRSQTCQAPRVLALREHMRRAVLRCGHDGDDRHSGASFGARGGGGYSAATAPAAECNSVCFAASAAGSRACSSCCARHFGVTVAPGIVRPPSSPANRGSFGHWRVGQTPSVRPSFAWVWPGHSSTAH
jgi:hypothetical protein